ncbi:MAG: hypothetical protein RIR97_1774 [Pseudomonadota bacterium]
MHTRVMYQADAFADEVFRGNPAAVLVLTDDLSDKTMQAIALENNLAETAFVKHIADNRFSLRWFTPMIEANFCGHATLATAHVLMSDYSFTGPLYFQTKAGELVVKKHRSGFYELDLPRLDPEPVGEWPDILKRLYGSDAIDMFKTFENYFVVLRDEEKVRADNPDFSTLAKLQPYCVVITARGTGPDDFVSRYYAPAAGIPEDPVTGSIHATLVPYWAEKLGKKQLSAYQASFRGGRLACTLTKDRVLILGNVVTYMKAEIYLPL